MKIICSQSELFKGVDIVSKAVPVRTPMSILECILITAENDRITLTANDTEIGIETAVPGRIEEPGQAAINAKILFDLIRSMPEGDVSLTSDENLKATIASVDTDLVFHDIMGRPGEEFSALPYVEKDRPIEISQFSLKEMIRQTIFSVSDNEANRVMTGELFEIDGDHLRVIAMDGHRISIRRVELKESYDPIKAIIPAKTLSEVNKIIGGSIEDMVRIYITGQHAMFSFEETTVVTRLFDGEFFNVDQMLSRDYSTHVKVNRKDMLSSMNRASLLIRETDKKPIILNVTDTNMNLSIQSLRGSMKEDIEVGKEGLDLRIGFNPKFFIDALRIIDDEDVSLYMDGSISPCFIKNEEETYIYLILPVNILNENNG